MRARSVNSVPRQWRGLILVCLLGFGIWLFTPSALSTKQAASLKWNAVGESVMAITPIQDNKDDVASSTSNKIASSDTSTKSPPSHIYVERKVIPPQRFRSKLGSFLESEGFTTGVELGVQAGVFAQETLALWKSCKQYVLVDIWGRLENYADLANKASQHEQEMLYQTALRNTDRWKNAIEVCRNLTTECAKKFQGRTFDYIYVDARHDYKGVLIDIETWWPMLNENGVMAGHDFVTQSEGPVQGGQNWAINFDGTVDPSGRAVYGAVMDFFNDRTARPESYRQISVTYMDDGWYTWIVRK